MAISHRSSDLYAALAYGHAPGSGVYVRHYVRLSRQVAPGIALVKGERMTAELGLELVDAARGIVLGRVAPTGRWTLAARGLEYLPAALRPARRAVAPDVQAMLGRLPEDAQRLIRCTSEERRVGKEYGRTCR